MKLTIDGVTVTIEPGDDPDQAVELIRKLLPQNNVGGGSSRQSASLTPKQRVVYDALAAYPDGAHYTAVADDLGLEPGIVNSRINDIRKARIGMIERMGSGTYRAVTR